MPTAIERRRSELSDRELDAPYPLSGSEEITYRREEAKIKRGIKAFHEVGEALLKIRDGRLYRGEFATFEDYCEGKWGISRSKGYRLIEASEVVTNLKMSPIGNKIPLSESQTRPLSRLPKEQQGEAWAEVQKRAEESNKPVTAATVQDVVKERAAPKPIVIDVPAKAVIIEVPPPQAPAPAAKRKVAKPEPPPSPLDYVGVNLMQNAFIDALDGDDPVPSYPNATLDYWAHKIRGLRDRVREQESRLSQSVSKPTQSVAITPGLGLQSRRVPEHTYTVRNKELDGAFLVTDDQDGLEFRATETEIWKNFEEYKALPNPFSDGKHAQYIDAASRLDRVKHFDLPQLRAALEVPGLQGTVRFAIERRIKKLEAVEVNP